MKNKLKLLITGATGFVGTNFINQTHTKYNITALVRENSNIDSIKSHCSIHKYSGVNELANFCGNEKFDAILHLATFYKPTHKTSELDSMIESNIVFGTQLLESLKNNPPKFFINTLTFSQFANASKYHPASFYDATKEAFYRICEFYSLEMPTLFTHLLLFNTYGANDNRPKIFNLWDKIAKSGEILEMSKGEQLIDISYISDVVNGFCRLISMCEKKEAINNQIYTLENTRYKLRDLASLFEKYTNQKLNIKWGAKPYRNREILEPISSEINPKLKKLPHWSPKISLKKGLKLAFAKIDSKDSIESNEITTAKTTSKTMGGGG